MSSIGLRNNNVERESIYSISLRDPRLMVMDGISRLSHFEATRTKEKRVARVRFIHSWRQLNVKTHREDITMFLAGKVAVRLSEGVTELA